MDNKECEVCTKMIKEKYKNYNTWKTLAIVFICSTVVFAILYFSSGDLFKETTIEYDNKVTIENSGDGNTNNDNGNITIENQDSNTGGVVLVIIVIAVGGVLVGCYIVSQKNNKDKKQSDDKK